MNELISTNQRWRIKKAIEFIEKEIEQENVNLEKLVNLTKEIDNVLEEIKTQKK